MASRTRIAARLSVAVVVMLGIAIPAYGDHARVPKPGQDHTAQRIDTDVWGWKKDFSEMAALGTDVKRGRLGEQRGEGFVVIFPVGSITPIHNVKVVHLTDAAFPNNPVPLDDVRDRMWAVDHAYQRLWPKRPIRKRRRGFMKVEPRWVAVEVEPTICRPAVGFSLELKGQVRYQPHQLMKMKMPCSLLKKTDHRTYWAKRDLSAVMIRFDYSDSDDNERSVRFPLSAAWKLADKPEVITRLRNSETINKVSAYLKTLGVATKDGGLGPVGDRLSIRYSKETKLLALQIAYDLGAELSVIPTDPGEAIVIESTR